MLKIGLFSKLSRVSIRMLRYYDEMGLLRPAYIDPDSDYRYYREDQLPQRASAQQHTSKTNEQHAEEVPQAVRVRHGLIGKAEMEVARAGGTAENEVADKRAD